MRKRFISAALLAVLILAAHLPADEEERDAAAVAAAHVSPIEAVWTASEVVEGGTPFEFDVQSDNYPPRYEVTIRLGGDRHKVYVDCQSGEVIQHKSQRDVRLDLIPFDKLKISLVEAMQSAQKKVKGQIIDADLVTTFATPHFTVELFGGGMTTEVKVDAQTGQITLIESDDD